MIIGGAQENTLYTVRGHLENGHRAVLVTGQTHGPEGNLLNEIPVPNLQVVHNRHLRREMSPGHDLAAIRTLKAFFLKNQFDVVHTHSSKAGVLARFAASLSQVPVITHTVHGPSFHPYQSRWKNRFYVMLERFAARYSHRNYTVADAMSNLYISHKIGRADRYKTVYSGMELGPYLTCKPDADLAKKLGLNLNSPIIGKVARLFELKGYDYLLEAAPLIVSEIPDVQFLIVGDGVMYDSIKRQIARLGLEKNFVFSGLVCPSSIHQYMALMNVLVHLSVREGLPRSVVQALAGGKPAVGFALDGTPEVILNGKTGFLCKPKDSKSVAESLINLLKNPLLAQKMGAQGREHVRNRWDWRTMVKILEADYEKLLKVSLKNGLGCVSRIE